jgi:hypothetical protein
MHAMKAAMGGGLRSQERTICSPEQELDRVRRIQEDVQKLVQRQQASINVLEKHAIAGLRDAVSKSEGESARVEQLEQAVRRLCESSEACGLGWRASNQDRSGWLPR